MKKPGGGLFNQKYFEGFTKRVVLTEDQRLKSEFVYEGVYYRMDAADRTWKRHKLIYIGLAVFCAAALILTMASRAASNFVMGVTLLQAVMLLLLLGMAFCLAMRLSAGRDMTCWEYRMAVVSLREFTLLSMLCAFLLAAVPAALLIAGKISFSPPEAACMGAALLCAGLLFGMGRMLKGERYQTEESRDMPHGVDVTADFPGGCGGD